MGTGKNPLVALATLIFGALIGVIGAVTLAYYSGFISWDGTGEARAEAVSATPGMDMLNAYQCRKSETKHIILGGVEDNFSPDGVEEIPMNAVLEDRFRRGNEKLGIGKRNYDEDGFDKFALDKFVLPAKTVRGLFVTRIKPLSELKNDGLSIGDLENEIAKGNWFSTSWYTQLRPDYMRYVNGLVSAHLEDMKFEIEILPRDFDSLLAYIRSDPDGVPVYVNISDDTMVDFFGFAVCAEPDDHMGSTYISGVHDMPDGIVSFSCERNDNSLCGAYSGDTLCSEQLPVICFKDTARNRPDYDINETVPSSEIRYNYFWSGGEVKLSPPVRGDQFTTADDVNEYCGSLFGSEWRAASHHESYSDYIIGFGQAPDGTKAWIDTKDEPHGSCWKFREDYKDENDRSD